MPRPRPSLVAREDVAASGEELAAVDVPSGKMGTTVGTEGDMLAEVEVEDEEERVREDAMIDMVVVIGVSVDDTPGLLIILGCDVVIDFQGFSVPPVVVSGQAPLHVGGVTGVINGTDSTDELVLTHELYPGNILGEPASVDTIPSETVFEA